MKQILIFTDLDGTLIDHDTYDFKEAQPALDQLRSRSIPVIICSSKTRAEIEVYRRRMGLSDPFIVENGGAVFIPRHMFDLSPPPSPPPSRGRVWEGVEFVEKGPYHVVELGVPYPDLCTVWKEIKKKNFRMKGFSEMNIEEIAACTGLPLEEATLAANREYSEPFMFSDTTAQQILRRVYANTYPDKKIWTAGLGDSANDIPMLMHVDMPIVIRKKTGEWEHIQGIETTIYSDKAGPSGWAEIIHTIL